MVEVKSSGTPRAATCVQVKRWGKKLSANRPVDKRVCFAEWAMAYDEAGSDPQQVLTMEMGKERLRSAQADKRPPAAFKTQATLNISLGIALRNAKELDRLWMARRLG